MKSQMNSLHNPVYRSWGHCTGEMSEIARRAGGIVSEDEEETWRCGQCGIHKYAAAEKDETDLSGGGGAAARVIS